MLFLLVESQTLVLHNPTIANLLFYYPLRRVELFNHTSDRIDFYETDIMLRFRLQQKLKRIKVSAGK